MSELHGLRNEYYPVGRHSNRLRLCKHTLSYKSTLKMSQLGKGNNRKNYEFNDYSAISDAKTCR